MLLSQLLTWMIGLASLFGSTAMQIADSTPRATYRWAIGKGSTLRIAGSSNVNKFTCAIPGYNAPDTLVCTDNSGSVRMKGSLEIDVLSFDCGNKMITKDLRKTLKHETYPRLYVRFVTLETMPALATGQQQTKGWVEVELAGVRKTFQLSYTMDKAANGSLILNGSRIFCFSDFRLAPPKKLAGIIKIRDEFAVDFALQLIPIKS